MAFQISQPGGGGYERAAEVSTSFWPIDTSSLDSTFRLYTIHTDSRTLLSIPELVLEYHRRHARTPLRNSVRIHRFVPCPSSEAPHHLCRNMLQLGYLQGYAQRQSISLIILTYSSSYSTRIPKARRPNHNPPESGTSATTGRIPDRIFISIIPVSRRRGHVLASMGRDDG